MVFFFSKTKRTKKRGWNNDVLLRAYYDKGKGLKGDEWFVLLVFRQLLMVGHRNRNRNSNEKK